MATKRPPDTESDTHTARSDLAAQLVEDWFAEVGACLQFSSDSGTLDAAIDAVQDLIEHEDSASDREENGAHELSAREAGYLIGVQVGLRLRVSR